MLVVGITNLEILAGFTGKKVFITGHTGFKGSWLCMMLHYAGATIKGYALAPVYENALFNDLESHLGMESQIGDIRNFEQLQQAILDFEPDFIFHLAAQPLVRYSYQHPLETFETNITGTAHVLEAMRSLPNKCTAVVVTTDKVYENNETGFAFKETDHLGGHDPYSSSKAAAEIITQSYQKSFFNSNATSLSLVPLALRQKSIATARAGNVIGGGDRATDRIIPDFIRSREENSELIVRNPYAVRPWQHVLDPLSGYLRLAYLLNTDANKYAGSYNFGPLDKDQCSVKEIVELAIKKWGSGSYDCPLMKNQPYEAHNLRLDITKAVVRLKWKPVWDAKTSVERTINWYKNHQNHPAKAMKLCVQDLEEFLKK